MTTNEFYYLLLICGAFTALGLGLAVATTQYWRSLRHGVVRTPANPSARRL